MGKLLNITSILIFVGCSLMANSRSPQLEKNIQDHIDHGKFHGIQIGVYSENTSKFHGFGTTSLNSGKTPNNKSLYEIGSVSKVFTGILLASLHLEKIVHLNDKIGKYIPELTNKISQNITLLELATHMSGLPRLPDNMGKVDMKDPYAKYDEKKLIDYLNSIKLLKKPNKFSWKNYSNTGFGLLGYALERATRISYEDLIKKYITIPLAMNDTFISIPDSHKQRF